MKKWRLNDGRCNENIVILKYKSKFNSHLELLNLFGLLVLHITLTLEACVANICIQQTRQTGGVAEGVYDSCSLGTMLKSFPLQALAVSSSKSSIYQKNQNWAHYTLVDGLGLIEELLDGHSWDIFERSKDQQPVSKKLKTNLLEINNLVYIIFIDAMPLDKIYKVKEKKSQFSWIFKYVKYYIFHRALQTTYLFIVFRISGWTYAWIQVTMEIRIYVKGSF